MIRFDTKQDAEFYQAILQENTKLKLENEKIGKKINKAIEYIENDLESFLYNIEFKTLLDILKEVSK